MGSMSIIEGNELLLRHLNQQDLKDFEFVVTNPLYGKFSPLGKISHMAAKTALEGIVANYNLRSYQFWVVVDKEENRIAGFVGHHPIIYENKLHEMFFIGFYTRYWGSKFPEQATRFACDFAFQKLGINRLISFVHPEDTTGLMSAQMMNAKFEGQVPFFGATFFLFSLDSQDFDTKTLQQYSSAA